MQDALEIFLTSQFGDEDWLKTNLKIQMEYA